MVPAFCARPSGLQLCAARPPQPSHRSATSQWRWRHPRQPAASAYGTARRRTVRVAAAPEGGREDGQHHSLQQQNTQQLDEEQRQHEQQAVAAAPPPIAEAEIAAELSSTASSQGAKKLRLIITLLIVMTTAVANRVLYKMSLVPLGEYVFFLAQLQTFGYLLVYFAVLALRYR